MDFRSDGGAAMASGAGRGLSAALETFAEVFRVREGSGFLAVGFFDFAGDFGRFLEFLAGAGSFLGSGALAFGLPGFLGRASALGGKGTGVVPEDSGFRRLRILSLRRWWRAGSARKRTTERRIPRIFSKNPAMLPSFGGGIGLGCAVCAGRMRAWCRGFAVRSNANTSGLWLGQGAMRRGAIHRGP